MDILVTICVTRTFHCIFPCTLDLETNKKYKIALIILELIYKCHWFIKLNCLYLVRNYAKASLISVSNLPRWFCPHLDRSLIVQSFILIPVPQYLSKGLASARMEGAAFSSFSLRSRFWSNLRYCPSLMI